MKILVVDDSQTMRKIIRNALEGMGYSPASILEATDGMDAIQMLRQPRFSIDIVLADSNMPNMDGLSLLKALQAEEELRSIPFIMVTGEAQQDRVGEVIRAGARDYVVKPFTPETLRQKVLAVERELLARRKPTDTAIFRLEVVRGTEKQPVRPGGDLPFLAQLPKELVAAIYESASPSEHGRGEVLMEPGEVVQSLHIVDRGEVEIFPPDGPEKRGPQLAGRGELVQRAAMASEPSRLLRRDGDHDVVPTTCSWGSVCGRGECFGELSFLSGDPAVLSARSRTEVVVASVEKSDFEDLLAEFPHLSFYLTRLLAKRARKADAELGSELGKGLAGRLSTIGLAELVQTLHYSRKTGLLHVESDGDEGEIYFVDGDVAHARLGDQRGEEALYRLVTWPEGNFAFETGSRPIDRGIFRATMGLLIEAMRRQDELRSGAVGPYGSRPGTGVTPVAEREA